MLTSIDAVYENELGSQALAIPIVGVSPRSSLLLRSVTGLNPPDLNLFIGDYARDGGLYQGRRVGNRNVVLMMDLNPNPALGESVSGLRRLLYKTFIDPRVDADYMQLVLHDDLAPDRYVVGWTEKFETEVFASETTVQISMICPDPYIRDVDDTNLTNAEGWVAVPFDYEGDAETGFEATIVVTVDTPVITLENNSRTMVITHPFVVGDVISINTNRGSRDILLNATTPLIAKLSPLSRWLEIHSASNTMRVYGETVGELNAVITALTYRAAYWGV